jgi:hypothetical protein
MSHDLIAELAGYRNELANYARSGKTDRVPAVEAEIERVSTAVRARVEQLLAQADNHEEAGQDVHAAKCRVEAKRLIREGGLDASVDAAEELGDPAPTNAAESAPRERAVTKKKGDS